MAEKGFGVKEVNLIGASGTPTITSPNNLNLNAVNVAISTNVSVGGTLTVSGNLSIGGTITYEDVTNIDSVGIITAREGVFIPDSKELKIGNTAGSADLKIFHDASDSSIANTTGVFFIQNTGDLRIRVDNTDAAIHCVRNGAVELHHAGTKKLETSSSGATVTGTLSATTFSGSGASLTSLPAANLTGTLPAISGANLTNLPADTPTNSDIQVVYTVTANGSSAYRFAGNGVVSTADDPDLYLIRGQKYRFINNSGGSHPFQIRESSGGSAYSTGVTNNGAASGNIDFAPTYDSPAQLVYQCTSHSGMVGNIYLRDAAGNNANVGVTTFIGHVQANNIKLDRGSASDFALRIDTTSSTGASRVSFDESGTSKGQVAYSHGNDQIELIGLSGNKAAIITNGNKTGFIQDTNGYITKPLNPKFWAKSSNAQTLNTDGTNYIKNYENEIYDIGSCYDGTNKFTAPITGYYHFGWSFMLQGSNADTFTYLFGAPLISGNDIAQEVMAPRSGGAQYQSVVGSHLLYLTSGQYVQIRMRQSGGSNVSIRADQSYFWGYLVG